MERHKYICNKESFICFNGMDNTHFIQTCTFLFIFYLNIAELQNEFSKVSILSVSYLMHALNLLLYKHCLNHKVISGDIYERGETISKHQVICNGVNMNN